MSHTCPDCGMACICDMEDHESDAPDDCCHECEPESDDVDIGVVGCFHQYIIIEGVLKCAVCDFNSSINTALDEAITHGKSMMVTYENGTVKHINQVIVIDQPSEIKWSQLEDITKWEPKK